MLHMTCDVIDIVQYHFLKSKMAAMYFAFYQNFKLFFSQFVLEDVRNRTKMPPSKSPGGIGLKPRGLTQ